MCRKNWSTSQKAKWKRAQNVQKVIGLHHKRQSDKGRAQNVLKELIYTLYMLSFLKGKKFIIIFYHQTFVPDPG